MFPLPQGSSNANYTNVLYTSHDFHLEGISFHLNDYFINFILFNGTPNWYIEDLRNVVILETFSETYNNISSVLFYSRVSGTNPKFVIGTKIGIGSALFSREIANAGGDVRVSITSGSGTSWDPDITPVTNDNVPGDYLYMLYTGFKGSTLPTTFPSGFTSLITQPGSNNSISWNESFRTSNSSQLDPGPYTGPSTDYIIFAVRVSPLGAFGMPIYDCRIFLTSPPP